MFVPVATPDRESIAPAPPLPPVTRQALPGPSVRYSMADARSGVAATVELLGCTTDGNGCGVNREMRIDSDRARNHAARSSCDSAAKMNDECFPGVIEPSAAAFADLSTPESRSACPCAASASRGAGAIGL